MMKEKGKVEESKREKGRERDDLPGRLRMFSYKRGSTRPFPAVLLVSQITDRPIGLDRPNSVFAGK